MSLRTILFWTIITALCLVTACESDDGIEPVKGSFDEGVLVLNQGNFQTPNASISFLSDEADTMAHQIFERVNGRRLGDTGQSISFYNDLAFIVVNNSQTIEVVNRFTFASVATIQSELANPRYMAFANGKAYVTNWGDIMNPDDDYIAVIDLDNYSVEKTIAVSEGPENIVANGERLYIAHGGGIDVENTLSVLNTTDGTVDTIPVDFKPNSLVLDGDRLWILCGGKNPFNDPDGQTAGAIIQLNTSNWSEISRYSFEQTEHPNFLQPLNDKLIYYLNGAVYQFNKDTNQPSDQPLKTGVHLNGLDVIDSKMYAVDAGDFSSEGELSIYDSQGQLIDEYSVGIIPSACYANE